MREPLPAESAGRNIEPRLAGIAGILKWQFQKENTQIREPTSDEPTMDCGRGI